MTSQRATSRALNIENGGQGAENSFNPMTNASQDAPNISWPLGVLIVFASREHLDLAFAPQALFQFSIIVSFIANDA